MIGKGTEDLELREQVKTIQTTEPLRSEEFWDYKRLEETTSHSKSSEKESAKAGVENSQAVNNDDHNNNNNMHNPASALENDTHKLL